jgi:RimJ/RimL family protein N-acetyltransferase
MLMRPATIDDAALLLAWRNDPTTRAMSKTIDLIEWDEHCRWLSSRLARAELYFYIAEVDGVPVGTVRIDGWDLSYVVAPEHRGCGVAKRMLQWMCSEFGPLRAQIKPGNIASIKAAERAGHIVVLLGHDLAHGQM